MSSSTTITTDNMVISMVSHTEANTQSQPTKQFSLRRSSRVASRLEAMSRTDTAVPAPTSEPRRNPKRKASEASNVTTKLPDRMLDEALEPLTSEDIQEWEGWVELESEPAFFNIILRDLGVKNVKAQEIFTMDQDSLDMLPKPVFGLIFLFQYVPGYDDLEQDEDTDKVWFANQTTDNACATIAMLNIVMNVDGLDIGDNLRQFRESTQALSTPLRGHQLSQNTFIRTIHNSFTRRMDHLNADLFLENEASEAMSQKLKKRATPKKGRKSATRKKKVKPEYGFHFIAYVPAGGYVWELDGLKSKPHRLDATPSGDWTSIARPQIEGRMMQYEENQLSFNLLALCRSPFASHSLAIARAIASLNHLHSKMKECPTFCELIAAESKPFDIDDASRLAEFDLTKSDIESAEIPESVRDKTSQYDLSTSDAYALHQELTIEIKAAIGEYRAEMVAIADDEQRVKGRKKDYGPALHKWVTKLAEKEVLEDVIKAAK